VPESEREPILGATMLRIYNLQDVVADVAHPVAV